MKFKISTARKSVVEIIMYVLVWKYLFIYGCEPRWEHFQANNKHCWCEKIGPERKATICPVA